MALYDHSNSAHLACNGRQLQQDFQTVRPCNVMTSGLPSQPAHLSYDNNMYSTAPLDAPVTWPAGSPIALLLPAARLCQAKLHASMQELSTLHDTLNNSSDESSQILFATCDIVKQRTCPSCTLHHGVVAVPSLHYIHCLILLHRIGSTQQHLPGKQGHGWLS